MGRPPSGGNGPSDAYMERRGIFMLKLSVSDIVRNNENCYSFVVAVSKRARQIAEEQREEEIIPDERPVDLAVEEFMEGKFHILQPDLNAEAEADAEEEAQTLAEEQAIAKLRAEEARHGGNGADGQQS